MLRIRRAVQLVPISRHPCIRSSSDFHHHCCLSVLSCPSNCRLPRPSLDSANDKGNVISFVMETGSEECLKPIDFSSSFHCQDHDQIIKKKINRILINLMTNFPFSFLWLFNAGKMRNIPSHAQWHSQWYIMRNYFKLPKEQPQNANSAALISNKRKNANLRHGKSKLSRIFLSKIFLSATCCDRKSSDLLMVAKFCC